VLAIVFAILWRANRRHKIILLGVFWFFIAMSVESSFVTIADVIAERRMYLPMVGLVWMNIYFLFWVDGKQPVNWSHIVMACLIVILSFLTYQRNFVWQNEYVFWFDVIKKSPNKDRGYYQIGYLMLKNKNYKKARDYLKDAVIRNPDNPKNYNALGASYAMLKQSGTAEKYLEKAYKMNPNDLSTVRNLAHLYSERGKYRESFGLFQSYLNQKRELSAQDFLDYWQLVQYFYAKTEDLPQSLNHLDFLEKLEKGSSQDWKDLLLKEKL
jgi:tetratricopeptide (TPR) repeat protein